MLPSKPDTPTKVAAGGRTHRGMHRDNATVRAIGPIMGGRLVGLSSPPAHTWINTSGVAEAHLYKNSAQTHLAISPPGPLRPGHRPVAGISST